VVFWVEWRANRHSNRAAQPADNPDALEEPDSDDPDGEVAQLFLEEARRKRDAAALPAGARSAERPFRMIKLLSGGRRGNYESSGGGGEHAAAPGESFLRVHWVAVPKAMRARRANRGGGTCLRCAGFGCRHDGRRRWLDAERCGVLYSCALRCRVRSCLSPEGRWDPRRVNLTRHGWMTQDRGANETTGADDALHGTGIHTAGPVQATAGGCVNVPRAGDSGETSDACGDGDVDRADAAAASAPLAAEARDDGEVSEPAPASSSPSLLVCPPADMQVRFPSTWSISCAGRVWVSWAGWPFGAGAG
jgi:hypothetical protein